MSLFYYPYPSIAPQTEEPIIVEVNARAIPIIISALERYKYKQFWASETDYQNGVQQLCMLQEAMLTGAQGIIEAIDRLTRYVDTAFNGTQYNLAGEVVSPPIAPIPPTEPANDMGALRRRLLQTQGTTGGFFGIGAQPVTLASLLQAGRVNTPADEGLIADGIEEIVNTVGAGGSIATALTNLLGTAADTATDGGLAAVQIASIVANAAAAGALSAQVGRLVAALDGGGLLSPADNNNNVLTLLGGGLFDSEQLGAAERLREIGIDAARISERIGAQTNGLNVNEHLDAIRQALRSLAGLEAAGTIATGSALQLQLAVLECICQGVTGTPNTDTFPPVGQPCGSSWPNLALQTTVTLQPSIIPGDDVYRAVVQDWEIFDPVYGVTWNFVSGSGGVMIIEGLGPRELCVSYALPEGATDPGPISINMNPVFLNDGGAANRPALQTNGGTGITFVFYPDDNISGDPIGYQFTIAGPIGVAVEVPMRIYIHAGAVG